MSTDPKLPRFQAFANLGAGLGGIGALLAALAAVVAAIKADDILDKILKIQTQTEDIKAAVLLLGQQIKANSAAQSVDQAQTSKGTPITDPATIDEILRKYPTMRPAANGGAVGVYLPPNQRSIVRDQWMHETDPNKRREALEQGLKVFTGQASE